MVDSLAAVAGELYALPPAEFTAARNSRARELKPADAALAQQVAAFRKPSPAAWLVNLLVRSTDERLDALLELGEEMRDAQDQLDREALRRLGSRRRDDVAALVRAAADLGAGLDSAPSAAVLGEVEQTLLAATSDEAAAAAVTSGLLVRSLRAIGFEPVDLDGAVAVSNAPAVPRPPNRPARSPIQLQDVRRRKEARVEAARLEREAEAAAAALAALERRVHRLSLRRTSLEAEIVDLTDQLSTAEAALAAVSDDADTLAGDRKAAEAAAAEADRSARAARAAADALENTD